MPRIRPVAVSRRSVTGSSLSRSRVAESRGPRRAMLASSPVQFAGRAKENPARSSSVSVNSAMANDTGKSSAPVSANTRMTETNGIEAEIANGRQERGKDATIPAADQVLM